MNRGGEGVSQPPSRGEDVREKLKKAGKHAVAKGVADGTKQVVETYREARERGENKAAAIGAAAGAGARRAIESTLINLPPELVNVLMNGLYVYRNPNDGPKDPEDWSPQNFDSSKIVLKRNLQIC